MWRTSRNSNEWYKMECLVSDFQRTPIIGKGKSNDCAINAFLVIQNVILS